MKRPILFASRSSSFMILLIMPLGKLALGGISEKYLPPDNSVRQAQEQFDKTLPRVPHRADHAGDEEQRRPARHRPAGRRHPQQGDGGQRIHRPRQQPSRRRWERERSYLDGAPKDRLGPCHPERPGEPQRRAQQDRRVARDHATEGLTLYVGGTPALEQDSIHSLFAKLPLMVVLLITTTTILMFLAFGSLVLPIKAALMSALTLGSTMGMLTWMFVDGHGSGLMNYTPQPLMAPMIGLIIAVIYGLSTDYEVFLVSRMVEARERGMSTTEAIRIGTATTGRLITAAALVLAVVAGAFVFSDLVMMKYLAFGLLIALLLDATIVRMFLVPAIMKLLGDDCWWAPRWMKRLQNKHRAGRDLPARRAQAARRRGRRPTRPSVAGAPAAATPRPPHDPTHPGGEARAVAPASWAGPEYQAPPARQEAPSGGRNRPHGRPQAVPAHEAPTTVSRWPRTS